MPASWAGGMSEAGLVCPCHHATLCDTNIPAQIELDSTIRLRYSCGTETGWPLVASPCMTNWEKMCHTGTLQVTGAAAGEALSGPHTVNMQDGSCQCQLHWLPHLCGRQ